jgi:hypothetical protein
MGDIILPFEVKYQSQVVQIRDIPGLIALCDHKPAIVHGHVITKDPNDIGILQEKTTHKTYLKIPACLFCYWLGASEFMQKSILI